MAAFLPFKASFFDKILNNVSTCWVGGVKLQRRLYKKFLKRKALTFLESLWFNVEKGDFDLEQFASIAKVLALGLEECHI